MKGVRGVSWRRRWLGKLVGNRLAGLNSWSLAQLVATGLGVEKNQCWSVGVVSSRDNNWCRDNWAALFAVRCWTAQLTDGGGEVNCLWNVLLREGRQPPGVMWLRFRGTRGCGQRESAKGGYRQRPRKNSRLVGEGLEDRQQTAFVVPVHQLPTNSRQQSNHRKMEP